MTHFGKKVSRQERVSYIMVLGRENDDLVELGEIRDEIVNAWMFHYAPATLPL